MEKQQQSIFSPLLLGILYPVNASLKMTILRDQEFSLAVLLGPVKRRVGCADQAWSSLSMQRVDGNSSGDFANEWLSKI